MMEEIKCPSCKQDARIVFAQNMSKMRRILWSKSIGCNHCGFQVEEDSDGLPTEDVRNFLCLNEGRWRVEILEEKDRLTALRGVKTLFGLDNAWTKNALSQLPRLWTGTKSECAWIKDSLKEQQVAVLLVREELSESPFPPGEMQNNEPRE